MRLLPEGFPMMLDASTVAALKVAPGRSELFAFDDKLTGFGFRIRGGRRAWYVQYRDEAGTQRRKKLGDYPLLSAAAARKAAQRELASVALGGDPQREKAEARERARQTFGAMVARYLEDARGRLRPRSFEEVERHLRRHWAPLADVGLANVTRAQIADRLDVIARENGRVAAARSRSSVSALFAYAMRRGRVNANPVVGTERPVDEADIERDRVLTDEELAAVWMACGEDDYGRIVRLLALTGQRREEVGGLAWSEVDLDRALWVLPRARAKNGMEHEVALSGPALDILAALPRRTGRGSVFGRGEGSFSGWSRAKASLDARITAARAAAGKGPIASWRVHDIRRSVATKMAQNLAVPPHVVEAVLNHASGSRVGRIYNRATYGREKRQALDRWADHLLAIVGDRPSNVVPLRAGAAA